MFSPAMSDLQPFGRHKTKGDNPSSDHINCLPNEVLARIFSLRGKDTSYSLVCKQWREIAKSKDLQLPLFHALRKAEYITSKTHKDFTIKKTLSMDNKETKLIRINNRLILFVNDYSGKLAEFDVEKQTFYETDLDRGDYAKEYMWIFIQSQHEQLYFFLYKEGSVSGLSIYHIDGSVKHPFISFDDFPIHINLATVDSFIPIREDLCLILTDEQIFKIKIIDGQSFLTGFLEFSKIPVFACSPRISYYRYQKSQYKLIQNHLLVQHRSSLFLIELEEFIPIPMTSSHDNVFLTKALNSFNVVSNLQVNPTTFIIKNNQFQALKVNSEQNKISYYGLSQKYNWELIQEDKLKGAFHKWKIEKKLLGSDSFVFMDIADNIDSESILCISKTCQYETSFYETNLALIPDKDKTRLLSKYYLSWKKTLGHPLYQDVFRVDQQGFFSLQTSKGRAKRMKLFREIGHFSHHEKVKIPYTIGHTAKLFYMGDFTLEILNGDQNDESRFFLFKFHV